MTDAVGGTAVHIDEPTQAVRALREDPHLDQLIQRHGPLAINPAERLFPRLTLAICRQQIDTTVADTVFERLADTYALEPAEMRERAPETIADVGLSQRKAETIVTAAEVIDDEELTKARLADADTDRIREELTSIPGVGPWTVDMVLIFVFDRPDVFPLGDLGIRRRTRQFIEGDPTRAELRQFAERWAPYRTTASLYLWADGEA